MSFEQFDKLGVMGVPLALCSIFAATVVFERTVFVIRFWFNRKRTMAALVSILDAHQDCPKLLRDEAVSITLEREKTRLMFGLRFLRIIATLSPLLGLLGTVFGIVATFKVIAAQTGPISPNLIADGLWEAMLTTCVGLMIALPSLFLAYFFQNIAERHLLSFSYHLNRRSLATEIAKERREQDDGRCSQVAKEVA